MKTHEKHTTATPAPRQAPPTPPPAPPAAPVLPPPPPRVLARYVLTRIGGSVEQRVNEGDPHGPRIAVPRATLTLSPCGQQALRDRTRWTSNGEDIEVTLLDDPNGAPLEVGKEYIIDIRPA